MDELNDLLKTGENILNTVESALNKGDYSNLGNSIRGQVQDAVNRAKATSGATFQGSASTVRTTNYASARYRSPFFRKKISAIKGIPKIVFGTLGAIYNAVFALACVVVAFSEEPGAAIIGIFFAAMTALFAWLIKSGAEDRKLKRFYEKYGAILGRAEYFAIDDLALAAAEKPNQVKHNIKRMVVKNFLPTARFDMAETTVMLSDRAYEQYIQAEMARKDREKFDRNAAQAKAAQAETADKKAEESSAVAGIIKEGNDYIENIRRINQAIPGDEMSSKLYRLENIMTRIFNQVEKEPQCADDLRKFMNYYLPTTTKLLNAYVDLDRQPEVGNNITQTKADIENTIDIINDAFENLLDSLFENMAWDISSDISVMKTMMAQDGLTQRELKAGAAPAAPTVAFDEQPPAAPKLSFGAQPVVTASVVAGQADSAAQTAQGAGQAQAQQGFELKF